MMKRLMRMIATKMMKNKQVLVDLPYASSRDFELILETVVSPMTPTGRDTMYGLRNKLTGVVELRGHSLAYSVMVLQNQQQLFDKVLTGEVNGFAIPTQQGGVNTDGIL
jgi:hypothetical protein